VPDTNFLTAFADHPITLIILMIGFTVLLFVWKVSPFMKDIVTQLGDKNTGIASKLDTVIERDKAQEAALADIKENVRKNTLDILRITIYNEKVDIEDRLVAARRYFLLGGNGKVAQFVLGLIAENKAVWNAVLAMSKPEEKTVLRQALGELAA
jgi:hypothetical protein